ncbi:hypothetical protein LTR17_026982 [Elasticomyces elasticus]|nr:hypothetical protein LTR17_026982 [Elasticomyces elasticus]
MDAAQQNFFPDHYPRRLTMPDYATTGFIPMASMGDDVHSYTDPHMANMNGNHNATGTLPSLATSSSSLRNGPSHAGTEQTAARNEERVQQFEDIMFKLLKDGQVGSVVLTKEIHGDNPNDPNRIIITVSGTKKGCNVDGAAATMANV